MKKRSEQCMWASLPIMYTFMLLVFLFVIFRNAAWMTCPTYPGAFLYIENRLIDSPEEAAALTAAETFNFSSIPTNTTLWSEDIYIYKDRLDAYAQESEEFDPYAHCSKEYFNYTAQITWCATLNLTITQSWELYPTRNPLTIQSNDSALFPYEVPDWPVIRWSAGYWNGTIYAGLVKPIELYFTDVFLIDMQLYHDYYFGSTAASEELELQQIIVDNTGRVLFVFWLLHQGPVA